MHSIIAAGFVCACNERATTLEDEEKKGEGKRERRNRAAIVTEASFQTTGKERNRSGALAKKNEAIALKKPGLKRNGNNLFGEGRGMRRRWRRIFRKRLTERQLFPRWSDSGADSVELVRGGESKAAGRECNSD